MHCIEKASLIEQDSSKHHHHNHLFRNLKTSTYPYMITAHGQFPPLGAQCLGVLHKTKISTAVADIQARMGVLATYSMYPGM